MMVPPKMLPAAKTSKPHSRQRPTATVSLILVKIFTKTCEPEKLYQPCFKLDITGWGELLPHGAANNHLTTTSNDQRSWTLLP
jgi:hypothetical protein